MPQKNSTEETRTCLECNSPLGAGRSDRKFCNDTCRTAYNNRRRSEPLDPILPTAELTSEELREQQDDEQIRKIQNILLLNRYKIKNMIGPGDFSLSLNDFLGFGVNLKFFTSEYKDTDRDLIFIMCFDHGYHISGDRVYLIYAPVELYRL